MELFEPHSYKHLHGLHEQGRISEDLINARVRPLPRTNREQGLDDFKALAST